MKIELTNEQYRALVELSLIGVLMREKIAKETARTEDDLADAVSMNWSTVYHLLSYAKAFQAEDMVQEDDEGELEASDAAEDRANDEILEFACVKSWSIVAMHLALRDLLETFSESERRLLAEEGKIRPTLDRLTLRYTAEFAEHGADRLRVVEE